MKLEERERALLKLVEDWRDQECRKIIAEAEGRAAEVRRRAFARERDGLHQRVVAERGRARALIQAARAERTTRERRRSEQGDALVIAAAWPRLRQRLHARWDDAGTRADWVASALDQALERLPRRDWVVRHPPGWPGDERLRLAREIERRTGHGPTLEAESDIAAGLVIAGSGAVLDMSLDGLLRDRARIDARLLALWKGMVVDAVGLGSGAGLGTETDTEADSDGEKG
jgi:hypothetical protein